jgi:hypothetical protein
MLDVEHKIQDFAQVLDNLLQYGMYRQQGEQQRPQQQAGTEQTRRLWTLDSSLERERVHNMS